MKDPKGENVHSRRTQCPLALARYSTGVSIPQIEWYSQGHVERQCPWLS